MSQQSFPLPEDVESALQALHPHASEPIAAPADLPAGDDFTVEEVAEALRGFAPGTAGGFSGLMPQHLRCDRPTAAYLRLLPVATDRAAFLAVLLSSAPALTLTDLPKNFGSEASSAPS